MGIVDDVPEWGNTTPDGIPDPLLTNPFDGEVNTRVEFDKLIRRYGHFVVLRRFLRRAARQDSFDELYEEASRDALRRLTDGRAYVDHLVLARKRTVVPGFEKQSEFGEVITPGLFFYMQPIAEPTEEDWIVEIALNSTGAPITPYKAVRYYNIMDPHDHRDIKGQLSHYRLRVERRSVDGRK